MLGSVRAVAVITAFCLLLTTLGACGEKGDDDEPAASLAQELAEGAGFDGVKSGELEVSVEFFNRGSKEELIARILGPFKNAGEEIPPELDMALESNGSLAGRKIEFSSGLLLRREQAVFYDDGQTYDPGPKSFRALKAQFKDAQDEDGDGNVMACAKAAEGLDAGLLVHDWKKEAEEEVEGVHTTSISGQLDVSAAAEALVHLGEDPACGAQLRALGMPPTAQLEQLSASFRQAVREASVSLVVDQDQVLRSLSLNLTARREGAPIEARFSFRLSTVNEVGELPLSSGTRPFASLLRKYGTDPQALEQASGSEVVLAFLRGVGEGLTGR